MPLHDWTRVEAGVFHHFHYMWIAALTNELNAGRLPTGYFAMAEQFAGGVEPDLLALELAADAPPESTAVGGLKLATSRPGTSIVLHTEAERYAAKARRIAIRHPFGNVVAVVEIVSPGNKSGRSAVRSFVGKSADFLARGVHLLVVDLFPPTAREPQGLPRAIWDEFDDSGAFELAPPRRFSAASFVGGPVRSAYVETFALGESLPEMPLFLDPETYVPTPLEATYLATWNTKRAGAIEVGFPDRRVPRPWPCTGVSGARTPAIPRRADAVGVGSPDRRVPRYAVHCSGISGGGCLRALRTSVAVADLILGGPGGLSRFLRG